MALLFGALGDLHGDFDCARRIMRGHQDVTFWVCTGDVADDRGGYEPLPAPLYWIKGNNENFDTIADGAFPANLHFVANAQPREVEGLRVVGLGGTLAPRWYDHRAAELPHPRTGTRRATALADKRRHFVREEVEACRALGGVDVFLSHEAPRPYRVGRVDAGKTPVNEVLAGMQPRLHLFGHHHRFTEQQRQGVWSVGLDLVSTSYLLIDRVTLAYERRSCQCPSPGSGHG